MWYAFCVNVLGEKEKSLITIGNVKGCSDYKRDAVTSKLYFQVSHGAGVKILDDINLFRKIS